MKPKNAKLSVAPKAEPQKTDAERLRRIDCGLAYMPERLRELEAHLNDLANLLYEKEQCGKIGDNPTLQAASILLEEYSSDVGGFADWIGRMSAVAEGKEEQESA